jgi:DNA-binding GntR family transcriptional regulator
LGRHRSVFEAIRGRDPAAAEAAMRAVLNHTSEDIERALPKKMAKKSKKQGSR